METETWRKAASILPGPEAEGRSLEVPWDHPSQGVPPQQHPLGMLFYVTRALFHPYGVSLISGGKMPEGRDPSFLGRDLLELFRIGNAEAVVLGEDQRILVPPAHDADGRLLRRADQIGDLLPAQAERDDESA